MKRIACLLATSLIGTACFGQTANKATASNPGFPRVVARLNLLNRTKELGPQVLYTPKKSGVFRVSAAMVCTVGNGNVQGSWSSQVSWSNEIGLIPPFSVAGVGVGVPSWSELSPITINVSGGTPIMFSVVSPSDTSGTQYNAYVILEQLE